MIEEWNTLIQLELNIFYVFVKLVILMSDNVFSGNFKYILVFSNKEMIQ